MTGKIPSGKTVFIWRLEEIKNTLGLDFSQLADILKEDGVKGVLVKAVEGRILFNAPYLESFAAEMKRVGIELHGWSYNYGDTNPERVSFGQTMKEYELSSQMIRDHGFLSWTVNAEKEFKGLNGTPNPFVKQAKDLMSLFKQLPVPVGFSSYKFPSSHNLPWAEFIGPADFLIPQVYWQGATTVDSPVNQLNKSLSGWHTYGPDRATIPAGTIYKESNYPNPGETWWPTKEQVTTFMQAVWDRGLAGVTFWELAQSKPRPELWEAVAAFEWDSTQPPTPPVDYEARLQEVEQGLAELEQKFLFVLDGVHGLISAVLPEPTDPPTPPVDPPTPPPPVDPEKVTLATKPDRLRIPLSFSKGLNNATPPRHKMEFYPGNSSEAKERVLIVGGSTVQVHKDSFKADGGDVYWTLVPNQKFTLAPVGVNPPPGVQLYINNKFIL